MTSPIDSANFSTPPLVKERKTDVQARPEDRAAAAAAERPDRPDVERAQELLSRQAGRRSTEAAGSPIGSMTEARERVAALRQAIEADPEAAIKATRGVDVNTFKAAMARPPA